MGNEPSANEILQARQSEIGLTMNGITKSAIWIDDPIATEVARSSLSARTDHERVSPAKIVTRSPLM